MRKRYEVQYRYRDGLRGNWHHLGFYDDLEKAHRLIGANAVTNSGNEYPIEYRVRTVII